MAFERTPFGRGTQGDEQLIASAPFYRYTRYHALFIQAVQRSFLNLVAVVQLEGMNF